MREDVQAAAPMTGMARKPAESGRCGHRGLALGLVLLAQLLVVIDVSIVTLALPAIQRAFHFSPVGLQWVLSGYALAFGGFLLLGGRLADLLGQAPDPGHRGRGVHRRVAGLRAGWLGGHAGGGPRPVALPGPCHWLRPAGRRPEGRRRWRC